MSEDSNSRFLVSYSSSGISFLFSCIVPIHVIRFSRSHLANGIDVYNQSNEMLQPAKLELVERYKRKIDKSAKTNTKNK